MTRLLYNLLFPLALLFFLPGYVVKMFRRGNYRNKFGQRLGLYGRATRARLSQGHQTWMHAVSVGEVMIALKLATRMRELDPNLRVALTTTTTTGFALASREAPDWIEVLYTPLDFWPIMHRAFSAVRPTRIVLVEAEVWPNLTATAHRRKIPFALVNARLSPRSEERFRKFNWFVKPYFQKLDLVCVQEPEDAGRWESLGVVADRIQVVGSIKFDPEDAEPRPKRPREVLRTLGIESTRPILLAGSTHQGEEEILGRIFLELRREFPGLFLIIAPRHAERTREIESQLHAAGLPSVRRSEAGTGGSADCLLIDTTGELRDWHAVAAIVFVGKSLAARGGQNPVEAILASKPVLFGPHMENFSALARALVANNAAIQVLDANSLREKIAWLLRDPEAVSHLVANAQAVLARHSGATRRTAKLVLELGSRN
jgi:3-deoxy-D-manno-octulosonic-acid transferase